MDKHVVRSDTLNHVNSLAGCIDQVVFIPVDRLDTQLDAVFLGNL